MIIRIRIRTQLVIHIELSLWDCSWNATLLDPLAFDFVQSQFSFSDYDKLDTEHSEVRINLKSKVAKLRDLEHKEELKGFNLQPLSKTELQSVSDLL